MPIIVVTRLRLKDPALLDEFFTDAVAAIEQAQKSAGNLGADALADAANAWWSVSAWTERGPMQAYVDSEPHLTIRTRLDHYCDEAAFFDWEQASPALPDWPTSWRHLTADGKAAQLSQPRPTTRPATSPARSATGPRKRKSGPTGNRPACCGEVIVWADRSSLMSCKPRPPGGPGCRTSVTRGSGPISTRCSTR